MLCVVCSAQLHTVITEKLSKYRWSFSCCRLFCWFSWYRFLYWAERNRKETRKIQDDVTINMFYHISPSNLSHSLPSFLPLPLPNHHHHFPNKELTVSIFIFNERICEIIGLILKDWSVNHRQLIVLYKLYHVQLLDGLWLCHRDKHHLQRNENKDKVSLITSTVTNDESCETSDSLDHLMCLYAQKEWDIPTILLCK